MNETMTIWVDRLALLTTIGMILAFLVVLVLAIKDRKPMRRRWLDGDPVARRWPRGSLPLAALLLANFLLDRAVASHARNLVFAALAPSANPALLVNGRKPENQAALVAAMRMMEPGKGSHSLATARIRVEITSSSGRVDLALGPDAKIPGEYWVLMPKYWVTSNLVISQFTSPALSRF